MPADNTATPAASQGGLPRSMAVIGGGTMGAGIAQSFVAGGASVVLVESGDRDAARARVADGLARSERKGALDAPAAEVLERLTLVADAAELSSYPELELVVEAVPEDPSLKATVLAAVAKAAPRGAVLASNTSSLSIGELAAAVEGPERFLGTHFFNPVPVSSLVELVVGPQTAPSVRDTARGWAEALGKTVVVVNDSPGFATSRLGVMLGLEAIRMLEEGVASAADIDTAMELGYRHPMGPLRSTDLVGLDVRLAIAEHLAATLGPRFEPPNLLRRKVADGELGRKTGRGFHDWSK